MNKSLHTVGYTRVLVNASVDSFHSFMCLTIREQHGNSLYLSKPIEAESKLGSAPVDPSEFCDVCVLALETLQSQLAG